MGLLISLVIFFSYCYYFAFYAGLAFQMRTTLFAHSKLITQIKKKKNIITQTQKILTLFFPILFLIDYVIIIVYV